MTTVALVLLTLALAFGGSGVAVFAAQDAMPNDPLYGIKLTSEDARVNWESDAQTRAELNLEFAKRRMNEIATLAYNGIVPPDAMMERQQLQIQTALHDAAGLDDPAMNRILRRMQTMLQEQVQTCDRLRTRASDSVTPALDRVRERLRLQLELTDLGLRDPQQFRTQMRHAAQEQSQERQQEHQPTAQPKPTAVSPQPTLTPQQQRQQEQQRQSSASAQPTAVQPQNQNQNQNQQQSQSSAQAQPTAAQQQNQHHNQASSQQQQSSSSQQNQHQSQSTVPTQPTPAQQQSGGGSSSASSNQSGKR